MGNTIQGAPAVSRLPDWPELLRELVIYARELREHTSGNADEIDPTSSLGRSMAALKQWDDDLPVAGDVPHDQVEQPASFSITLSGQHYNDEDARNEFVRADYIVTDKSLRLALELAIDMFIRRELPLDADGDRMGFIETITCTRAELVTP